MPQHLFTRPDLRTALEVTARDMAEELQGWNPDALLVAPVAEVIAHLVDKGSVRCPELLRDQCYQEEAAESVHMAHAYGGREIRRRVQQITFVVPYVGEREVFELRPNSWGPSTPYVDLTDTALRLVLEVAPESDATQLRAQLDTALDQVERYLVWSRRDIEEHNQRIAKQVPEMVANRRQQLLTVRNLQAEIGFPIRHRSDASTYSVPVTRRRVRVSPPRTRGPAAPFKPEPVLPETHYEDALAVLLNSRNALERSPDMAATLSEERIRDLLLFNLNAQFEGQAGGELFNGAGKTDILIRVDDRNVFIGECKIWRGPKTVDGALQQLFSYLVWRDTKAALLLFIRTAAVTDTIEKAVARIEAHPNYKRRGRGRTEERHDFVMHATGDPDREIHLAFLPFALPSRKGPS